MDEVKVRYVPQDLFDKNYNCQQSSNTRFFAETFS